MRYRRHYAAVGILLGLCAPAGALIGRLLYAHRDFWIPWLRQEWTANAYFYVYMAVGSLLAFGLFGYGLGRRGDRLKSEKEVATDAFATLNLLAITDGLTGLYNHRYLQERLSLEMESAARHETPLTCLMIDLDNFKQINDAYGHPFGDFVLATIARIIRETIRRIDTAGRYGGEEFLVVMPNTAPEAGREIAERIRQAVEQFPFSLKESAIRVTLSIGLASFPAAHLAPSDKNGLLQRADRALYQAKRAGKNRTVGDER